MKTGACTLGASDVNTVQEQHVKMNIQIQGTAKTLDQRDRTGVSSLPGVTGFMDQVRCNGTVHDAQHPGHDRRLGGEQKSQWVREAQYPLAHGLFGQDLVDQQGCAFSHATRPATGAKTATFATEGHQMLSMAVVVLHAQEAMFQATAFEVGFEFALYIPRQNRALLGKIGGEFRIMSFNYPVKQVVFGLVALIAIRAGFLVAASCRSAGGHELHPCETVDYKVYHPDASKRSQKHAGMTIKWESSAFATF